MQPCRTRIQGYRHYPGWSKEVLKLLYEDRKITASGHETTDTDRARTPMTILLESYILGLNHYQIEMLAKPRPGPEAGALVIVTWPKAQGARGSPRGNGGRALKRVPPRRA